MRTTYSSLQHQARKARTWFCKEKQAILETHFMYVCLLSRFSHVWLFATPWIAAHEGPLSMGFSKQEYWSGLPCPPPGDPPSAGFKPVSLTAPALAGGVGGGRCIFTAKATWEAHFYVSVQFSSVAQSCPTFLEFHGIPSVPGDSPSMNTGVGCHAHLQGILLTQGSNSHLLHWQVDSLPLSH